VCLVIAVTGDWLAVLVFGAHFQGTEAVLLTLAFSALVASLGHVAGCGLWAVDEPRKNYLGAVCGMAVTLTTAALLIPPLGVLGAALATLAGMTASAVAQVIMLERFLSCTANGSHVPSSDVPVRADAPMTQSVDLPDARCEVLA
jgi:O-antigen/teichoic acid export membrane protein